MNTRVLLAEDHTIVREGLRALLSHAPGVEVVGEAADGRAAVSEAARLRPDVVVLDLSMPVLDGVAAIPAITASSPGTAVLVLSMHAGAEHVEPALRAGAKGYIVKGSGLSALVSAIATVARGGSYVDPHASRAQRPAESLVTPREREVLALVAAGLSSGEIAAALDVSVKTVETHRANLLQKLAVPNVAALVDKAHRLGLVGG
jgi:DNA-binding NarL/FixJ family response regulator